MGRNKMATPMKNVEKIGKSKKLKQKAPAMTVDTQSQQKENVSKTEQKPKKRKRERKQSESKIQSKKPALEAKDGKSTPVSDTKNHKDVTKKASGMKKNKTGTKKRSNMQKSKTATKKPLDMKKRKAATKKTKVKKQKPETSEKSAAKEAELVVTEKSLSKDMVTKAVSGLLQTVKTKAETDLLLAAGEADKISLIITLNKLREFEDNYSNVRIKLDLPHGLFTPTTSVCLFVKDLDRSKKNREHEETVEHFKELLEKHNITQDIEIIPLKQIKTEFIPYEAKNRLKNMYDAFLTDDRIYRIINSKLGKAFLDKKKSPKAVNLCATDLKGEIEKTLNNPVLTITGKGACCMTLVAHTHLKADQIIDNITSAFETLCKKLPGGGANIKALSIKTPDSISLPIYYNPVAPQNIVLPEKKTEVFEEDEPEEVTTIYDPVVVTRDGTVKILKNKKANEWGTLVGEELNVRQRKKWHSRNEDKHSSTASTRFKSCAKNFKPKNRTNFKSRKGRN